MKTRTSYKPGKAHRGYKHGMRATRFYRLYAGIIDRCRNPRDNAKYYKEKGITVEWPDFMSFMDDMYTSYMAHVDQYGEDDTTIDRVDPDKNYCKENCRWATRQEQSRNRAYCPTVTINGITKKRIEWCRENGIDHRIAFDRIKNCGWSPERAVTQPVVRREQSSLHI